MSKSPTDARQEHLEQHIQDTLDLIREYEEKQLLSDEPKEKAGCRKNLEELHRRLKKYRRELETIQSPLCPPDSDGTKLGEGVASRGTGLEFCERESLVRQFKAALRTLHVLEEKAAAYPLLETPTTLQLDLEEKRRFVARLRKELSGSLEDSDE